uniref:Uncharacterized protein n=1 Tax=Anopheles farauti TaxID=69004 RepID=A0A182Q0S3_9DIPT
MKHQHLSAVAIGFLLAFTRFLCRGAPLEADTLLEEHDFDEIKTFVLNLIQSGINISLDEHQIRFIKGESHNLLIENFTFATEDGRIFTLSSEKLIDKNSKPKVVSNFDANDDDAQKVLLSMIGGGKIKTLTLFSVPLETLEVGDYCDRLEMQLGAKHSPMIVLQIGHPSQAYEVIAGKRNRTKTASGCEFDESEFEDESECEVKDRALQEIQDNVIAVKSHRIVEYITLLTLEGEFLLTLERTGDLEEPLGLEPKFGGDSAKDKLLLSLVGGGGGRIKSFDRLKKP